MSWATGSRPGADRNAKPYPTAGPRIGKNRHHPDLTTDGDVDAEAARLVELGARRVDVGQRNDDPFVVLADPEGNEFGLLRRSP